MSLFATDETREWLPGVPIELLLGFRTVLRDVSLLFTVETPARSLPEPVPTLIIPVTVPPVLPPVVPAIVASVTTAGTSVRPVVVTTVEITVVALPGVRFLHSDFVAGEVCSVFF
jgi:hypothetical protein